jgi:hypothetical protein
MGSGADMEQEAKILAGRTKGTGDFDVSQNRCDPFPVKLCPRCESLETNCECGDSPLRNLEEAVASWRAACDKMENALLDFLAATWKRS